MTRVYYREAVGAFVVFDCTRPKTFDNVRCYCDAPLPFLAAPLTARSDSFAGINLRIFHPLGWRSMFTTRADCRLVIGFMQHSATHVLLYHHIKFQVQADIQEEEVAAAAELSAARAKARDLEQQV